MTAPSEAGRTRPSHRTRGLAPLKTLAWLLVFFSALPGFAQSYVSSLPATEPTYVAIDTIAGTTYLYVSEHGDSSGTPPANGGQILKFNLTSGSTTPTVIATRGTADGQFISPDAILVDPATHNLFIADRYLDRIQEITATGTFVMKWGSNTSGAVDEMHGPVGLARDSAGAIYVSEHGDMNSGTPGTMVGKYTIDNTAPTAAQVWRKGNGLNTVYSVAVNGSNQLLISDGFNFRVQVWDLNGNPLGSFNTSGSNVIPLGQYIDATGALWLAESVSNYTTAGTVNHVVKLDATTGASAGVTLGSQGSGPGQFELPFDTAINSGLAYISDYQNNRVQIWDLTAAPPPASIPVINSSATVSGTVGTTLTYNVTATNSPTGYAAIDALPGGLMLDTTSGVVTGIPSTAGTVTTHFTATNSAGTSAAFAVTFTIGAATTPPVGDTTAPTINSIALGGGATLTHANFVVTFSEPVTGVDPNDFAFNKTGTTTGATITGVASSDGGTSWVVDFDYDGDPATNPGLNGSLQLGIKTSGTGIADLAGNPFVGGGVTASDAIQVNAPAPGADLTLPVVSSFSGSVSGSTATFTLTFSKAVTGVDASDFITTSTGSATATVGTVTGSGTTYTVPVTVGGNGTVSVTVIGGVTANIRDTATNWFAGGGTSTSNVVTVGTGTGSVPVITSAPSATATVGAAFSYQITASNSPTSYDATNLTGTGLSLNTSTGVISGTPGTAGTITSQLTATNSTGTSAAVTLTITVNAASGGGSVPVITSAPSATATAGAAFSYQITASNSPTSYDATNLTGTGLSLNTSTGVISGTPGTAGTITSQLTATNSTGTSAAVTLTITVNAASGGGAVPVITSAPSATATAGAAFSYQITASNSPTSFDATNLTGTGLSLNTSTGVISGTPGTAGTISSQLTATNSTGTSAAVTLTITVNAASSGGGGTGSVPVITSATSATATVGTAFSYQIAATNSPTSYDATNLADTGLSLNTSTGVISGTPGTAGTITSQLTATNSTGTSAAVTLTITVNAGSSGGGGTGSVPVITSATSATATAGAAFSYQITASNSPTSFDATNLTGTGLSLNTSTGVISGTPGTAGTISSQLTATNSAGTSTAVALTITVNAASSGGGGGTRQTQTITIITPVSSIFVGDTITLTATASSGLPVTYQIVNGDANLTGNTLMITSPGAVVVRASQAGNTTFAPASSDATFVAIKRAQSVNISSVPTMVHTDSKLTLGATTDSGLPITYSVVSGPATVSGNTVTFTGTGTVVIRATQPGNATFSSTSADITITGNPVPRLVNISSRTKVTAADADGATIVGFVVTGTTPKQFLIRAVGPSLASAGVKSPLADPTLKLYDSKGATIATNSGWNDDTQISAAGDGVGAFQLLKGSKDAAILATLQPGTYTAQVESATNTGTVLVEVYDVSATASVPTKQLINISTRGVVGTGDDAIIGGFAVSGNESKKVLIRAVGPALSAYGVGNVLADPVLTVYNSKGVVVATNDNWDTQVAPATASDVTTADSAAGAFPLAAGSADAAIVLTLDPGTYSVVITGVKNTTGNALMEIYEVPNP